jgi:acetyl-CoA carboxylase carboxyl transferase subunit beta
MEKTKLKDAVRTGVGKSKGREVIFMDFAFIEEDQWVLL